MIEEDGVVAKIEGDRMAISIHSSEQCKSCGMCQEGDAERMMYLKNNGEYHPGDRVKVSVDTRDIIKVGFYIYIVPLLCFFLGYFLGTLIAPYCTSISYLPEMTSVLFLTASLGLLRLIDTHYKNRRRNLVTVEKYQP